MLGTAVRVGRMGPASAAAFGGELLESCFPPLIVPQFPHESPSINLLGRIYYFLKALSFAGDEG